MRFYESKSDLIGEKVFRGRHASGLEVVIVPKDHEKAFALFGTRYGSVDRTFKTQHDADFVTVPDGIAHFLEHKLFENEDGSDTFARFAETGASCNAFTSTEMTAYLFSATKDYYQNLDILLDFVTHPYFTEQTVQKEMGIIGQEIRMGLDEPFHALYYNLLGALYHDHPIKVDVAGTEETISHITADILYRCYRTFYNPSNMLLVLAGKWDKKKVAEAVDRHIPADAEKISITRSFPKEKRGIVRRRVETKGEVALPLFAIGLKEGDLKKRQTSLDILKKEAEHEILSDLLFGRTSALYNRLYEEGLISEKFDVEYNLSPSCGTLLLYGESRKPEKIFRAVRDTVKNAASLLEQGDFERSRRAVYAGAVQDWNSTTEIAEAYMDFAFSGADMLRYPEVIAAVTKEDLLRRIEKSYRPAALALSVVKPVK